MAVRPIDAEWLLDALNSIVSDYTSEGKYPDGFGIDDAINLVDAAPTLTPPNERLYQADIEKMDGRPVWVEFDCYPQLNGWHLVYAEVGGRPSLVTKLGGFIDALDDYLRREIAVYRRPPEGEA